MGDGICAYFGVPAAHEDDAERAAWAALGILDTVARYALEVEQAWGITRSQRPRGDQLRHDGRRRRRGGRVP